MNLILGYGNALRCDDGAGLWVAEILAREAPPDTEVRTLHQLGPELADDLGRYEAVVFVDAAQDGPEVDLRRLAAGAVAGAGSSHHLTPQALGELSFRMHGSRPELYVCTVRGESFGFGVTLSRETMARAEEAVRRIRAWLQGERVYA